MLYKWQMGNLQRTLMIEIEIVKQTVLIYIRDCLFFYWMSKNVEKSRNLANDFSLQI